LKLTRAVCKRLRLSNRFAFERAAPGGIPSRQGRRLAGRWFKVTSGKPHRRRPHTDRAYQTLKSRWLGWPCVPFRDVLGGARRGRCRCRSKGLLRLRLDELRTRWQLVQEFDRSEPLALFYPRRFASARADLLPARRNPPRPSAVAIGHNHILFPLHLCKRESLSRLLCCSLGATVHIYSNSCPCPQGLPSGSGWLRRYAPNGTAFR